MYHNILKRGVTYLLKTLFLNYTRLLNVLIILLCYGYLIFRIGSLPPQVPLWYTLPWGENQLTSPQSLWLIPISLSVFLVLNTLFSTLVLKEKGFLTNLLNWQGVLISLLGLVALWRIIVISIP